MRYPSSWLYAAGAPAFVLAGLAACSGASLGPGEITADDASSGEPDGTCGAACDPDAGHHARGLNDASVDADASSGTTSDATTSDTSTAADASDVADAAIAPDGPVPTVHEVCRATWAQLEAAPETLPAVQVAVDPSGNMYVAEQWESGIGISIVKLDATCQVLWTRQLRSPADAGRSFASAQLTVAADSSVLLAGAFDGTIDFGKGPISAPDDGTGHGFVERLTPDGSPVFVIDYGTSFPTVLSPDSGGVTSLLFFDYDVYDCAYRPAGCADGGQQDGGALFHSFAQLDGAGHEVARHPFSGNFGGFGDPVALAGLDPDGGVWLLESHAAVVRYTVNGDVLWRQPASGDQLALTPSGGVVFDTSTKQSTTVTLRAFGFDGGALWTQSTIVPLPAEYPVYLAVGPRGSIYIGGQALPSPQAPEGGASVQVFDPQGQLQGLRIVPEPVSLGYMALGVDPSGNAVVAGSLAYEDGGFHFVLVKLAP